MVFFLHNTWSTKTAKLQWIYISGTLFIYFSLQKVLEMKSTYHCYTYHL